MNMTDENEMTEEIDSAWQPGPTVEIDWWGGRHSDLEADCYCEEEDTSELDLE
jgi:hypothetical protein